MDEVIVSEELPNLNETTDGVPLDGYDIKKEVEEIEFDLHHSIDIKEETSEVQSLLDGELEAQETVSNRGNIMLVCNGFKFYKQTDLQHGKVKWRCNSKKCSANMYTIGEGEARTITTKNLHHNHEPIQEQIISRHIVSVTAKRKAVENLGERPSTVFNSAIKEQSKISITEEDVKRIKRNLYNARRKELTPLPTSISDD